MVECKYDSFHRKIFTNRENIITFLVPKDRQQIAASNPQDDNMVDIIKSPKKTQQIQLSYTDATQL